jgi:hypothetical protein
MDTAGMIRGVVASTVCVCALVVAGPAAARSSQDLIAYTASSGNMSEAVSFHGDGTAACARAGLCNTSGTISYGFGGIRDGGLFLIVTRTGHRSSAFGYVNLDVGGLTTTKVTGSTGTPPCSEQDVHKLDLSLIEGHAGRVRLLFHPVIAAPSFLESDCPGPSDADISHAHALPTLSIPMSQLREHKVTLATSSQRTFHSGPFAGTVSFSVSLSLVRVRLPSALTGG